MSTTNICGENVLVGQESIAFLCKKISIDQVPVTHTMKIIEQGINDIASYLPNSVITMLNARELFYLLQKIGDPIFFFEKDEIFGKENNRINILSNNYNYGIIFDSDKTIIEMVKSYSDCNLNYVENSTMPLKEQVELEGILPNATRINIFDQFIIDFPRMQVYINYYKCDSIHLFQTLMSKYKTYTHPILQTVFNLIVMLCTQASFYYPYQIIHTLYSLLDHEICAIPSTDPPCINIIENKSSIEIVFKKMFKYFDAKTEQTLCHFSTYFVVTIDLVSTPDRYIYYGKKYGVCSSTIVYWFNDKNLLIV